MTRYLLILAITGCLYAPAVRSAQPSEGLVADRIDKAMAQQWRKVRKRPAGVASDDRQLRRLTLDLLGRIPSAAEMEAFASNREKDRWAMWVDRLTESGETSGHWANNFAVHLIGRQALVRNEALYNDLYDWLEPALRSNRSYYQMATDVITADGLTEKNGAAAFYAQWAESPENVTGHVGRVFMGMRLQCAQCHAHMYEPISKKRFWETAAFTVGLKAIRPDDKNMLPSWRVDWNPKATIKMPKSEADIRPVFVIGEAKPDASEGRREALARIMRTTAADQLAAATVNWIWSQFFGSGFVMPVEDMSLGDRLEASHPAAFAILRDDFRKSNGDLRRLMRIITRLKAYRAASQPPTGAKVDNRYLSYFPTRAMTPEQLLGSLAQIADLEQLVGTSLSTGNAAEYQVRRLRGQMRNFVRLYDNDEMKESLEFEGTIPQALFMMNSRSCSEFVVQPGSFLARAIEDRRLKRDLEEHLFLRIMSRMPSGSEKVIFRKHLRAADYSLAGVRDVAWVLLNSSAFMYVD